MAVFLRDGDAILKGISGRAKSAAGRKSKYGNHRLTVNDPEAEKISDRVIRFDSKKEANRWFELKLLVRQGTIWNLKRQVVFPCVVNGFLVCKYIADFSYETHHPTDLTRTITVVEDVKSPITRKNPVYRVKAKLFRALYKINIQEV